MCFSSRRCLAPPPWPGYRHHWPGCPCCSHHPGLTTAAQPWLPSCLVSSNHNFLTNRYHHVLGTSLTNLSYHHLWGTSLTNRSYYHVFQHLIAWPHRLWASPPHRPGLTALASPPGRPGLAACRPGLTAWPPWPPASPPWPHRLAALASPPGRPGLTAWPWPGLTAWPLIALASPPRRPGLTVSPPGRLAAAGRLTAQP